MNKFSVGMIAGLTMTAAGLMLLSDRSIRKKFIDKSEDLMEKAENFTDKYIKQ